MQHVNQGTYKKSPLHYEDGSNNHIDNTFKQYINECRQLSLAPVPQTSMLVLIGVAVASNIEFQGSGVHRC